MERKKERSN